MNRNQRRRRALDLGTGPVKPEAFSQSTPCAIDLDMTLLRLPKEQAGQMKKMMEAALTVVTKHVDFLHRETFKLKEENAALTTLLKDVTLKQTCSNCTFTTEFLLENGCCDLDCIAAGDECLWLQTRRRVHGVAAPERDPEGEVDDPAD